MEDSTEIQLSCLDQRPSRRIHGVLYTTSTLQPLHQYTVPYDSPCCMRAATRLLQTCPRKVASSYMHRAESKIHLQAIINNPFIIIIHQQRSQEDYRAYDNRNP